LVRVNFDYVELTAKYRTGESFRPQFNPKIRGVDFLGPLKFIKDLQDKLGNLGGGFRLDLTPVAVGVKFGIGFPSLGFGVFSLRNIELGAAFHLSLVEAPLRFTFNFSSWEKPFELSVMCFSGRGGFQTALQSDGHKELSGF